MLSSTYMQQLRLKDLRDDIDLIDRKIAHWKTEQMAGSQATQLAIEKLEKQKAKKAKEALGLSVALENAEKNTEKEAPSDGQLA
jgi:hypothetical protein